MNTLKTTVLLAALTGVLVIMGNALGGSQGALIALIFAGIMNFTSYWFSDKIVLAMYKARAVDKDVAPQLFRVVERIAQRNSMPMPKIFIIDSDSPNAFATGRSPAHASVAATSGILRLLTEDELEGVMAHELAHVKNRDTLISTVAATIAGAITWLAHMAQWAAIMGGGRRDSRSREGSGLVGTLLMALLAPLAAMLIQMAVSRAREYAADEAGARMSGKPLSLASALSKLSEGVARRPMASGDQATAHLFIVNPFKGASMGSFFSTHPPMEERVRRLQELSRQM